MTSLTVLEGHVPAWEPGHTRRARNSRGRRDTATKNERDTGEDVTPISHNNHDYYSN